MALDAVFVGPPGAGKGTQAKRVAADLGIPHIATGDMLRAAIAAASDLGRRCKEIVDRGDLVPDELMIQVIRERLAGGDTERGFILDGFPRTLAQAEALDAALAELDRELDVVLEFQIAEDVVVERMLGRAREEGRSDDSPDVIRRRLEVYRELTAPLLEHYRTKGILVGVHADASIDQVFAEVQSVLEAAAAR